VVFGAGLVGQIWGCLGYPFSFPATPFLEIGPKFETKRKEQMKRSATSSVAVVLLALMAGICQAQDFSADVVYTRVPATQASPIGTAAPAAKPSSRIFVSKSKLRLESRGMINLVMLVDSADHTTIVLYPDQKAYQRMVSRPSQYFRAADAGNACPDWQEAAGKQLKCEKVGEDVTDGRKSIKYRNTAADGSAEYVWIDSKLSFVIKWDLGETAAELHNIKEGQQPAGLFEIPPSYDVLKPVRKPPGRTGLHHK